MQTRGCCVSRYTRPCTPFSRSECSSVYLTTWQYCNWARCHVARDCSRCVTGHGRQDTDTCHSAQRTTSRAVGKATGRDAVHSDTTVASCHSCVVLTPMCAEIGPRGGPGADCSDPSDRMKVSRTSAKWQSATDALLAAPTHRYTCEGPDAPRWDLSGTHRCA